MAASASSLTFRLFGEDVSASKTLDKVGVEAEGLSGKFGKLGAAGGAALAGIAVAAGVVGAASVKMAMDFDQQMTRISTQAHVPQAALKGLSNGVLGLASQVGFGPKSLAEALYHVESSFASTGITSQKAMQILKIAAEGAAIGGSNLVDTTNAMDAAVVSGIKGVDNYSEAMGRLNATVGAGDMSMQDLADALGTGVLAVIKGYGVTLSDASAALATFGDNNIRGAQAGTNLRMAIQALAVPVSAGKFALEGLGISAGNLQKQMQQGGLNYALQVLIDKMTKAGITGDKMGGFITNAFGKRAGTGLAVLMEQFDRFESKYAEADKGANQFASDWQQQQQQFSQVLKDLESGMDAIGVKIGNYLIPKIMSFGETLATAWHTWEPIAKKEGDSLGKQFMEGFNGVVNAPQHLKTPQMQKQSSPQFASGGTSNAPSLFQQFGKDASQAIPYLEGFWKTIQQIGTELYQKLVPYFKDWGTMLKTDVGPALKNFWYVAQQLAPVLELLAKIAAGVLIVTLRAVGLVLKDVVGPGILGVSIAIRGLTSYVVNTFWPQTVKAWDAIKDGAVKAFGAVVTYFKGLPNLIVSAMGSLGLVLVGSGQDLITGLFNGALDAIKGVGDWVKKIGSAIIDAVKGFFGIHSPSTVFHEIGGHMMQGLFNGLIASGSGLSGIMKDIFADAIHDPIGWAIDHVKDLAGLIEKVPALGAAIAKRAPAALAKAGIHYAGEAAGAVGNFVGGGSLNTILMGKQLAADFGWTGSQWTDLYQLWQRESGWNPNAVNPSSGAYGIPQALGHGHPYNLGDAPAQIEWGLQYIAGRYGNPANAWAHEVAQGWYAMGGRVGRSGVYRVGDAGAENVYLPQGAYVASHRDSVGGGPVIVNLHGPVYSDSAGIKRLMTEIDREVSRGGSVPATFRR